MYEMDIIDGILAGWLASVDYYLMIDGLEGRNLDNKYDAVKSASVSRFLTMKVS